jgi:hypothetical protein
VNNLAALYDSRGRHAEAESLHKRVLEAASECSARSVLTLINKGEPGNSEGQIGWKSPEAGPVSILSGDP